MSNRQTKRQLSFADQLQSQFPSGKSIHTYLLANETSTSRDGKQTQVHFVRCTKFFTHRQVLKNIRDSLFIKPSEDKPDPGDPRLSLAREWLESCPGASDLFSLFKAATEVSHFNNTLGMNLTKSIETSAKDNLSMLVNPVLSS